MIYQYKCHKCNVVNDVVKSIKDSERKEKCPDCKNIMKRVYTAYGIRTGDGYKS